MLFTFPSRYWFTIGLKGVFSLAGWAPLIHAEFLVLRATQDTADDITTLPVRGFHPLRPDFPDRFRFRRTSPDAVLLPRRCLNSGGLGCSAFARRYLRNHMLFSLPAGTKMFQFPAFAHHSVCHGCTVTGCPIRTPRGQGLFAPHPGFSQLTASFIASLSLGIRRPPLFAFPYVKL